MDLKDPFISLIFPLMLAFIHRVYFFIIHENGTFVELSITSAVIYCLSRDRSDTDICGVHGFGENEKHLISFLQRRRKIGKWDS